MIFDLLLTLAGLACLIFGGDYLVKGAVSLAAKFGIPSLLIGLTIVAFGTSAPELVVSIQAVLSGDNGIAVGNIIGSNIANVLLVLGLPALIAPIALSTPGLRRHASVMILASLGLAYIIYVDGVLGTTAGICLLVGIVAYVAMCALSALRGDPAEVAALESEVAETLGDEEDQPPLSKSLFLILLGLIGLPLGGTLLVSAGADLASQLGVRDELIGLTIVAFGTSLPELATVWAAARKKEAGVAVGNVVGSNIFNILFVGGAMGLVGRTGFTEAVRIFDLPTMLVSTALLAVMIYSKGSISRGLGVLFTIAYVGYIAVIGGAATTNG